MLNQTRGDRVACRSVDGEVERFLRGQKHRSVVAFCESFDPSVGLGKIWSTIRSLSVRSSASKTDRTTGLSSPVFRSLRDPMNGPLSDQEL